MMLYEGEWTVKADGSDFVLMPHGFGKMARYTPQEKFLEMFKKYANDITKLDWYYEGELKNGMYSGSGCLMHLSGHYRGGFVENVQNGYGMMVYQQQLQRKNESGSGTGFSWKEYSREDISIFATDPVHLYDGYWKNGKPHGLGIGTHFAGGCFLGLFAQGEKVKGSLRWHTGTVYSGEWKVSKPHGKGDYLWLDGRSYKGGWHMNNKDGYGIYKWEDGSEYKGNWSVGLRQGIGEMVWRNKKTNEIEARYTGTWHRDERVPTSVQVSINVADNGLMRFDSYFAESLETWQDKYKENIEERRIRCMKENKDEIRAQETKDKDTHLWANWRNQPKLYNAENGDWWPQPKRLKYLSNGS
eukprot:TRINITY_DN2952_c0_g1_i1.p1 TRINITY_DN2952_c0_g1~~TRINITY_DN2952_c0_g1_i1.p1  ORF type:complete len:357 (-),score=57.02 TRINITY_DN2952_c0_g1_i1:77-1147(-)